MSVEQMGDVTARAAVHAALADPARLVIKIGRAHV